jgi:hypothetical protein
MFCVTVAERTRTTASKDLKVHSSPFAWASGDSFSSDRQSSLTHCKGSRAVEGRVGFGKGGFELGIKGFAFGNLVSGEGSWICCLFVVSEIVIRERSPGGSAAVA